VHAVGAVDVTNYNYVILGGMNDEKYKTNRVWIFIFLCDICFVYHNISQPIINAGH
jgi:hypothetical protein